MCNSPKWDESTNGIEDRHYPITEDLFKYTVIRNIEDCIKLSPSIMLLLDNFYSVKEVSHESPIDINRALYILS